MVPDVKTINIGASKSALHLVLAVLKIDSDKEFKPVSFGDSDKAKRVIPNKLFQALAVGKPALTADTPAIRELLTPDEHIFTSEPTPDKIAEKIRFIRTHEKICHTVSINGYRFFQEKLSIEKLGAELKTILKDA